MQLLRASFRPDSDTKQAMNLQAVKLLAIDSFKQAHHKEVDGSATSDAGDQDCRRGNSAPPLDCRVSARVHTNWPSWVRLLVTGPASTFGEIQTRLNCFTLSFPVHCLSKFFFFCQKLLEWRLTDDSVTWKRHSVSDLAAQIRKSTPGYFGLSGTRSISSERLRVICGTESPFHSTLRIWR